MNGTDVAVHRANDMLRLVDVPAGGSRVEFRYRPTAVAAGVAESAATVGLLAAVAWRARRRG